MTTDAAVATPADATEAKGGANPGEANATTEAAKDGGAPASTQATLQTDVDPAKPADAAPSAPEGGKPAADPPVPAAKPQRTEAEIEADINARREADEKERTRQANIKATNDDLRTYRREAPIQARDFFATLKDEHGIDVPLALQKPFLDLVNAGLTKGEASAKLEFEDQLTSGDTQRIRDLTTLVTDGYYAALPDSLHAKYTEMVNSKPPSAWAAGLLELASEVPAVRQKFLTELHGALADAAPEGEERDAVAEALKGAKDLASSVKAYGDTRWAAGTKAPSGEPKGTQAAVAGGLTNMRAVSAAFTRREITRAEYRDYQARNGRGQFPD